MKDKVKILENIFLVISLLFYGYFLFVGTNRFIYNMSYAKSIIFILLICLTIYTYGIYNNKDEVYKANINKYIILYFILLISVTFFIDRDNLKLYDWWYAGQYRPLHTIISQLEYGSSLSIWKNIVGNSIMLIPLSFLLMLKNKKYYNVFKQLMVVLPIVIAIEVLQAFTHTGSFDIDDILLNYLFTIIFTLIITRFSLMDKIKKLFYKDYIVNKKIKYIMLWVSIILLVIYIVLIFNKII